MTNSRPSRIAIWIAVLLAACAAPFVLALFLDPPEYTPSMDEGVMDVASLDGALYAKTIDSEINMRFYVSRDLGATWNGTNEIPESLDRKLGNLPGQSEPYPFVCDPSTAQKCFRVAPVAGSECSKLEESRDRGESWETLSLPANLGPRHSFCPGSPFDIAFVQSDSDGASDLVVAMGTAGILVRSRDGIWKHYGMERF